MAQPTRGGISRQRLGIVDISQRINQKGKCNYEGAGETDGKTCSLDSHSLQPATKLDFLEEW